MGYYRFDLDSAAFFESGMERLKEGLPLVEDDTPLTFSHNNLHDLESLWWVCAWELLFYCDQSWAQMSDEDIQRRSDTILKLFPRTTEINHRLGFLDKSAVFLQMLQWVPKDYSSFKLELNLLRAYLVSRYEAFDRKMDGRERNGAHEELLKMFQRWRGIAQQKKIQLEPYKWATG